MNDKILRDMEIHPDFYKRMREANIKLEKECMEHNNVRVNDWFGDALVVIALIIFVLIVYGGFTLLSYMGI